MLTLQIGPYCTFLIFEKKLGVNLFEKFGTFVLNIFFSAN